MGRRWSEAEDELLRRHADMGPGWEGWERLLPARTYTAICARRQVLGIQFGVGGKGSGPRGAAPKPRKQHRPWLRKDVPWTHEQDTALLRAACLMVEESGHGFNECVMHLLDLVRGDGE